MRPRLLDLFSGAGGAAVGYDRAGFEVVGVDNRPMPRYPFTFIEADALEFCREHGHEFEAIHASPPCQAFTQAQRLQGRRHPDLIEPVRHLMRRSGSIGVIENVPGAPLRKDLLLCGSMFGLTWEDCTLYRHRWFEGVNWTIPPFPPTTCHHSRPAISIFGRSVLGASRIGRTYKHPNERHHLGVAAGREVMGCDWMTRAELSEAIPPAYTEFIGSQLLAFIQQQEKAII